MANKVLLLYLKNTGYFNGRCLNDSALNAFSSRVFALVVQIFDFFCSSSSLVYIFLKGHPRGGFTDKRGPRHSASKAVSRTSEGCGLRLQAENAKKIINQC